MYDDKIDKSNLKTAKVNGSTYAIINGVLRVQRLVAEDEHLVIKWYLACGTNRCKIMDRIHATKILKK